VLNVWRNDYNARPHSALGNLTPTEFAARNAPRPQRSGALRYTTGSAPCPRCSTEPHGLKSHRDSPHCWMNRGAQTRRSATCLPRPRTDEPEQLEIARLKREVTKLNYPPRETSPHVYASSSQQFAGLDK
jgi:putative transposase